MAGEFVHDDHAFEFEAVWELWVPTGQYDTWTRQPRPVKFFTFGTQFEDGTAEEMDHVVSILPLDRLNHGFRAYTDLKLMEKVRKKNLCLCL